MGPDEIYVEQAGLETELATNISVAVASFAVSACASALAVQVLSGVLRRRYEGEGGT